MNHYTFDDWKAGTCPCGRAKMESFLQTPMARRRVEKLFGRQRAIRKFRLFLVYLCHQQWRHLHGEWLRNAVDAAEQFADGTVSIETLRRQHRQAFSQFVSKRRPQPWDDRDRWNFVREEPSPTVAAMLAYHASWPDHTWKTLFDPKAKPISCPTRYPEYTPLNWRHSRSTEPVLQQPAEALHDIFTRDLKFDIHRRPLKNQDVRHVANFIYQEKKFEDMPLLADALIEAGCTDAMVLDHCQQKFHTRGCWLLDLILDSGMSGNPMEVLVGKGAGKS